MDNKQNQKPKKTGLQWFFSLLSSKQSNIDNYTIRDESTQSNESKTPLSESGTRAKETLAPYEFHKETFPLLRWKKGYIGYNTYLRYIYRNARIIPTKDLSFQRLSIQSKGRLKFVDCEYEKRKAIQVICNGIEVGIVEDYKLSHLLAIRTNDSIDGYISFIDSSTNSIRIDVGIYSKLTTKAFNNSTFYSLEDNISYINNYSSNYVLRYCVGYEEVCLEYKNNGRYVINVDDSPVGELKISSSKYVREWELEGLYITGKLNGLWHRENSDGEWNEDSPVSSAGVLVVAYEKNKPPYETVDFKKTDSIEHTTILNAPTILDVPAKKEIVFEQGELEICSYLLLMLDKAGKDITKVRFCKKNDGSIKCKHYLEMLTFKSSNVLGKYVEVYSQYAKEHNLQLVKNGSNDYVGRYFFNCPTDLDSLLPLLIRNYDLSLNYISAKSTFPGYYITKEEMAKLLNNILVSNSFSPKPSKNKGKPVLQLSENGTVLKEYESITSAAKETGIDRSNIRLAATSEKHHAGGYKWKFKDNLDK